MFAFPRLRDDSNFGGNGLEHRKSLSETVNGSDSVAKLLKKRTLKRKRYFPRSAPPHRPPRTFPIKGC